MADDAEEKKIARLDFDVDKALKSLDKVNDKLKTVSGVSEQYAKNIGLAINNGVDYKTIAKSIGLSESQLKQLTKTAQKEAIITRERRIREENKTTEALTREHAKQAKSIETISDKISNYAKTYLIYQGFNMLKNSISDVIDEMVEVEYQMVQIDRVLSESDLNIDAYRDNLIKLANDYGNSFNNVADITLRLAQAGFDSSESLALTEKTLLALNTAELDATQATSDMVAIMAQWGLMTGNATQEAKDYGDIVDKINKVADNFPTTSADILEALKKTSSAFNLAGASIDETIATIVAAETASQRGGKAIGTALSNIIQQLKESKKINIAESLGIDFYTDETKTQFKDIMDIFTELSQKMQQLKNEGKENSVEMQNLLSVFTVFRRNIGASLLGEMAGEDSTYAKVLKTSIESVGYSMEENEKHMKTAKAAQAQFNATLLELKTNVWDGGVEDVFRNLLTFGNDLVGGLNKLIDTIGLMPTAIGAATLAFSLLNKSTQASTYINAIPKIKEINNLYKNVANNTKLTAKQQQQYNTILANSSQSFQDYSGTVKAGQQSLGGYIGYLTKTTVKTALLTVGTIALQAAISAGLTLAITAIVTALDNWIHAEEKAIEKSKQIKEEAESAASELNQETNNIRDLRQEYEKLAKKEKRTPEENQKIYELQTEINKAIKDSGVQVDLVTQKTNKQGKVIQEINDKYDEQLSKIKAVEYEKKKQEAKNLKTAAEEAQKIMDSINSSEIQGNFFESLMGGPSLARAFVKAGISKEEKTIWGATNDISVNPQMYEFNNADITKQIDLLTEWKAKLETVNDGNKDVSETLGKVEAALSSLQDKYNATNEATQNYKDALSELYAMNGYADNLSQSLQAISDSYNIEGPRKLIKDIQDINTQFSNGKIDVEEYFDKMQKKIEEINLGAEGEELEAYQAIFAETTKSLSEGVSDLIGEFESGEISFADYANGVKEAADNMLELRKEQNNLSYDKTAKVWKDAAGNVDTYATSLQNAINEMDGMSGMMDTISENYKYIAENANAAGEAAFDSNDLQSKSYQNLANSVAISLNKMKNDNETAYNAIKAKIIEAMGDSANEVTNADTYITSALNGNAQALNAALNESARQVALSTNKVTVSMGNVLSELGNAISGFTYNITATPYISGGFSLKKDKDGMPTGLQLPTFGFDIKGTGGGSIQNLGNALKTFGSDLTEYSTNKFTYQKLKSNVKPYSPSDSGPRDTDTPSYPPPGGGGGGSSDSGSRNKKADEERKAEEKYKKRLAKFEDTLNKMEKKEEAWVKKQQELGMLSNKDMLYITKQRISRYNKYLKTIKKATWMNKEDRKKMMQEYTDKIKDLQLEYFEYLKGKLEEETEAIEKARDKQIKKIEEKYDKQIKKIEETADAEIAALRKVEKERDRDREKEDYEEERKGILDEIDYWSQRTGREAKESLAQAKKDLEELDEEWKRKQEDWNTEDLIEGIEKRREKEVEAAEKKEEAEKKKVEKEAQKKIDALKAEYDYRVKVFAESNKIIYDNSKISAKKLYKVYRDKFVDPLKKDMEEINNSKKKKKKKKDKEEEYINYTIKSGDTLSAIAKKYKTTVAKILDANSYIKDADKIYAGDKLKIPKFHQGGIVGGNKEALALLKPNEVILKPEWAEGINRLAKMAKESNNMTTSNTNVTVKGDLVRIDANIKDKNDAEYLTRKIEKMLKDKFNIKK